MQIQKTAFALALASALLPACAKSEPQDSKAAASAAASEEPTASDPLMREMLGVVKSCKINTEHSVISQCADKEKGDLVRDFRRGGRDKMKALPVLVEALESPDPKLQTVAARILEGGYRSSFGEVKPGAVDKSTATRMIAAMPKLGKRQSNQVIGALVHASVLSGEREALFKLLDGLEDKVLRTSAYGQLMVHGGKEELAKVTALANGDDMTLAAAALQAARNYKGTDAALTEQVCALGDSKIGHTDAIVSMRAAQIMVKCNEASIDKLLEELDKRTKDKALTTGLVRALYELCQPQKEQVKGSETQCKRVRGMLEKWIGDTTLAAELRAAALFEIGVQFPDEKSEKLCQKYENDAELRVKTAAKESLRRIQRKLGKEVVNLGGPPGASSAPVGSVERRIAPVSSVTKPPKPPTPVAK